MNLKSINLPVIFVILISVGLGSSCNKTTRTSADIQDTLLIDGSSTVFPLTESIVDQYNQKFGDLKISISVSGTGGGFSKFVEGQIDINNASREIKPEEKEKCESNHIEYTVFKVAIDGIAIVANTENTWASYLSIKDLQNIWSDESVIKWSDVKPDWPNEEILLYSPGEASGTYDYFKEVILEGADFKTNVTKSENDNLLALGIANNQYSLGFFALPYFESNKSRLRLLAVDGKNGPILPDPSTIASGVYSPLSRPLFIYVNNEVLDKPMGKKFVRFYLNKSASSAQKVGYVPLSNQEYASSASSF